MRYLISFFFSLSLFLNPTLKATPDSNEQAHNTKDEIYTDKKEQIGQSEDSNDLYTGEKMISQIPEIFFSIIFCFAQI